MQDNLLKDLLFYQVLTRGTISFEELGPIDVIQLQQSDPHTVMTRHCTDQGT
jgi:hypothetical protein